MFEIYKCRVGSYIRINTKLNNRRHINYQTDINNTSLKHQFKTFFQKHKVIYNQYYSKHWTDNSYKGDKNNSTACKHQIKIKKFLQYKNISTFGAFIFIIL